MNFFLKSFIFSLYELRDHKYLVYQTIRQKLVLKYRRTFLGYLWTLLNPLCLMSITALVFSSLYRVNLNSFAIYMFSGMLVFNLFKESILICSNSYLENEHILTKIYVPRIIFPLSSLLMVLIDNILLAFSISIIGFFIGVKFSLALLFIPFAYLILFFLCLGFCLIFCLFTVYLRDLQYILGLLMQALLFLTPVFIKPDQLFGKVKYFYTFNPLSYYIQLFRKPFLEAKIPDFNVILFCVLFSIITFLLGFKIFEEFKEEAILRL